MLPEFDKFLLAMCQEFDKHHLQIKKQAEDALFEIREAAHAAIVKLHEGQVPPPGPLESLPEPAPIPPAAPIGMAPAVITEKWDDDEEVDVADDQDIPDESVEEFVYEDQRNIIITAARAAYGLPYKFGGGGESGPTVGIVPRETEKGFDCSGLVFFTFHLAGLEGMPRTSQGLFEAYKDRLVAYEDTKPGDLMFTNFKGKDNLPDHVSIIAPEDHKVIEAGDPVGLYGIGDRGETKYAHIFND